MAPNRSELVSWMVSELVGELVNATAPTKTGVETTRELSHAG